MERFTQLISTGIKLEQYASMYLIFFFEAESASEEASVICVCFNIRYAPSLLYKRV